MTKPSDLNDIAGYLREPINKNQDDIALLRAQVNDLTERTAELERVLGTVVAWLLAKEPKKEPKDGKNQGD